MVCNPQISVIVPVYKAEKYLEECVQSILSQTYRDFELILIDDGSPDRCGEICDHLAASDGRIVVHHKKNEGVSIARNTGISLARGEYLTFVDSDDSLDAGFLEAAITGIRSSNADLYISGLSMETWKDNEIIHTDRCTNSRTQVYTVKELLEKRDHDYPQMCICGPWCKLYKKSIISEHALRFPEAISCGEDTYFVLGVLEHCSSVYFDQNCFYHYSRGNEESLFSRFHADTYEIHRMVYSKMRELMKKCSCSEGAMGEFEELYFELLVGGIHEYHRFHEKTTRRIRLAHIAKVAKDPDVMRYRLGNIRGIKNKVIFLLLRFRLYHVVALIFEAKYCRR